MELDNNYLGNKIRSVRKAKKMTQEKFCEDESDLSVKQLSRIERGKCMPNIQTLYFIANRLGVPVAYLIEENEENINLSNEYFKLKDRLIFLSLYREEEFINKQQEIYEEIEKNFFSLIPESQKLLVTTHKLITTLILTGNIDASKKLLDKHLSLTSLQKKSILGETELIMLKLHLQIIFRSDELSNEFEKTLKLMLSRTNDLFYISSAIMLDNLIISLAILIKHKQYDKLTRIISSCYELIIEHQLYHKMPILKMVEGKKMLFTNSTIEIAKEYYEQGITIAKDQGAFKLAARIKAELNEDLSEHEI